MAETDATQAETSPLLSLLEPFPPEYIGKLPRVTCKDCSDPRKECNRHDRQRCDVCNSWISTQHIHIDYVGHADVTRRLLEVDPQWTWDPVAEDEHGLPLVDTDENGNPVGLWIKLTVLGVTRRGYGSCPSRQGDAIKVLIGDALRNAAMRFGVALDLWAKGDRANPSVENAVTDGANATRRPRSAPVKTDHAWLIRMEHRIAAATSHEELRTVANEVTAKVDAGGCEQVHHEHLWTLGEARNRALAAARERGDTPPAATESEGNSAERFERRLEAATTAEELDVLRADVMAAFKKHEFDPTTGNKLLGSIKAKAANPEAAA